MAAVDKDALFTPRLAEQDVEIEGVGTLRIRALSRAEVLGLQNQDLSAPRMEQKLLALALVNPRLTEDEVKRWQRAASVGELEPVTDAVMAVSGMNKDAAKEAVKTFRDDS